ncbi:MAG TPA: FHA domain-containing protein [Aggregatilineales bacterium]|nr:FHA domain-containing protein [Aggregatilineales bacterium]
MQSSGSFRLIVRRGPQPNQIYELNKDIITLGRDITNDIVINDPECSRHHCRLTRGGGGYTLEDLGSTNGTFVNGQRLTGARPLAGGDVIGMGETVTLAYESTIPAPEPGQQPTMVGSSPSAAPMFQPAATQQTYQQPAPQYAPPPPPPPQYQYQEPVAAEGGFGRWFFIGCGCLIVLCIVLAGVRRRAQRDAWRLRHQHPGEGVQYSPGIRNLPNTLTGQQEH